MDELAVIIGGRIKKRREEVGLSQKALAEKATISPSAINKFEKGEKKPSTGVLVKIAEVLNTTTDYFLSGQDEDNTIKAAFRGFNKLSSNDQDVILGLMKRLQEKDEIKEE